MIPGVFWRGWSAGSGAARSQRWALECPWCSPATMDACEHCDAEGLLPSSTAAGVLAEAIVGAYESDPKLCPDEVIFETLTPLDWAVVGELLDRLEGRWGIANREERTKAFACAISTTLEYVRRGGAAVEWECTHARHLAEAS